MPCVWIWSIGHENYGGNGGPGGTATWEFFLPQPMESIINVHLYLLTWIDEGVVVAGIRELNEQLTPNGPVTARDFGDDYWNWPPAEYSHRLTSVVLGVRCSANTLARASINVFL